MRGGGGGVGGGRCSVCFEASLSKNNFSANIGGIETFKESV